MMKAGEANEGGASFCLRFRFGLLCRLAVSLPMIGLLLCFITANIFQQHDIHETYCRVYNVIPSISSITGISPQRYLWRVCIALHVGPRFLTSLVYRRFHKSLAWRVPPARVGAYLALARTAFVLDLTEQAALIGVTYVSNRENYPVHEKIFISFLISSQVHMLAVLKLLRMAGHGSEPADRAALGSYRAKCGLFAASLVCTCGLCIFFVKHRVYCHDLAFSWFSLCEYCMAAANMGFHATVIWDFPNEDVVVGCCPDVATPPPPPTTTTPALHPPVDADAKTK